MGRVRGESSRRAISDAPFSKEALILGYKPRTNVALGHRHITPDRPGERSGGQGVRARAGDEVVGGGGVIRTHGPWRPDGFQDRCFRPLSPPSGGLKLTAAA